MPSIRATGLYACVGLLILLQCGCVTRGIPEERVIGGRKQLTLNLASKFAYKFGYICRREKLNLVHLGPLAWRWRPGPMPQQSDYNAWRVVGWHLPGKEGLIPKDRATPGARVPWGRKLTEDDLVSKPVFRFRLGYFKDHDKNVIPISMGEQHVYVQVTQVYGAEGIDTMHPMLGATVREFIKRVELHTPFDQLL